MIVVADTSPVQYIVQLGFADLFRRLYGRLLLPREVQHELTRSQTPPVVRSWISQAPEWVEIGEPGPAGLDVLRGLDPGERAAIELALERHVSTLLIDERKASGIAKTLGFKVTGTLGILRDAHLAGLANGFIAYERLTKETNFRHTPRLSSVFLEVLRRGSS